MYHPASVRYSAFYDILASHSGAAEFSSCLGCDVSLLGVYFPTFRKIVQPLCLRSNSERKVIRGLLATEDGGTCSINHFESGRYYSQI